MNWFTRFLHVLCGHTLSNNGSGTTVYRRSTLQHAATVATFLQTPPLTVRLGHWFSNHYVRHEGKTWVYLESFRSADNVVVATYYA